MKPWQGGFLLGLSRYYTYTIDGSIVSGSGTNVRQNVTIDFHSVVRQFRTNYTSLDAGGFLSLRALPRWWLQYQLIFLKSMNSDVLHQSVEYSVFRGSFINEHSGNLYSEGSAWHHSIGIRYSF